MARLRNRIRKADYWSDPDLCRWHRDKRASYSGLYAIAEDSGCLENDPFQWKMLLWPSPLDADITLEKLEEWRDELIAEGKLVQYWVEGREYLYIKSFHKHEHPRNPQGPSLPLPPWISWVPSTDHRSKGAYIVEELAISNDKPKKTSKAKPKAEGTATRPATEDDDFVLFWSAYPNRQGKVLAQRSWLKMDAEERAAAISAADSMRHAVESGYRETDKCPHGSTFLNQRRWEEWGEGPPPGYGPNGQPTSNPTTEETRPVCWMCGAQMSADEHMEGNYTEGKGWSHDKCPVVETKAIK